MTFTKGLLNGKETVLATCGVSKVQITLDGETNTVFRKTVRLSEPFSRKDSLIE